MKAIFVSKDNKEYNRYATSVNGVKFDDLQVSQGNEIPGGVGNCSSNELSGDNGDLKMAPIVGKKITIGGTEVVVLDGDKLSSKNNYCYGSVKLDQFLSEISGVVKSTEGVRLFVHWGNGGTAANVARIEQKIEQEFQSVSNKRGVLSIQSISSRRDNYFKVSAPTQIVPPCTDEEINDLHNKLKRAQKEALPPPYHVGVDIERIEQITDTSISAVNFKVVVVPMSGSPRLAGNDGSGDSFINSLKQWLNKRLGIDVVDLSTLFADTGNASQYVIPLFVYDKWDSKAEQTSAKPSYEKWGLMAPKEFLIEYDEGQECCIFGELENRFKYWAGYEKNFWGADKTRENLRDWLSGTFRKYCFQDEHVHGSGSLMDLHKLDGLQSDIDEFIEHWLLESNPSDKASTDKSLLQGRFISKSPKLLDEMEFLAPVLNVVYRLEIEKIGEAIKHIRKTYTTNKEVASLVARIVFRDSTKNDGIPRVVESEQEGKDDLSKVVGGKSVVLYGDKSPGAIVVAQGSAIRFTSPTLKFSVLVVDDKAEEERNRLKAITELKDIFAFDAMKLKGGHIVQNVIVKFKRLMESGRTYDFALLDLSLGEEPGSDLSGYLVVKLLHQFFPHMPVIIYSQFSDMGHIARAFYCGAKWFLKKDEVEKLPRQVMSIVQNMQWEKEWLLLNENKVVDIKFGEIGEDESKHKVGAFERDFTEARQFLTYKCLEKYPGTSIWLKKMGGGLSGAVTFRAIKKGTAAACKTLPTPVIVKIDSHFNTMSEYERYFRFIRPYIANECGRVENPAMFLDRDLSAIVYTYAGKQDNVHELKDMKTMMSDDIKARSMCDYEKYRVAFDEILDEILPRIHGVTDFVKSDAKSTLDVDCFSSYPNPAFGEFCRNDANDLFANYLCRMPVYRKLEVKAFRQQQPLGNAFIDNDNPSVQWEGSCYEFHGVNESDAQDCTIECYDHGDKCVVLLTGGAADHIVRYRRHLVPGMSLWVDGAKNETVAIDGSLNDKMIAAWKRSDIYQWQRNLFGNYVPEPNNVWFNMQFVELVSSLVKGNAVDDGALADALEMLEMKELGYEKTKPFAVVEKFVAKIKAILQKEAQRPLSEKLYSCPKGIVHGDLNTANIMLDSLKHPPKEDSPDITTTIRDSWLIDFARSRRDYISHDFNVFFTSVVVQLFDNEIWKSDEYRESLERMFPKFIHDVVVGERDAVPDYIESDGRFTMIYKMLRRIRKAALKAGVSQAAYTLTTAMACMVTFKLYLRDDKNASVQTAAGLIAIALLCLAELKEERPVK